MVARFEFVTFLIVSCAACDAKVIESFSQCESDGWSCDDKQEEATFDCKEVQEGADLTEYTQERPRNGSLWTSSILWKGLNTSTTVQRLVYKNCWDLEIDLLSDNEPTGFLALRNIAYLKFLDPEDMVDRSRESELVKWPKRLELKSIGYLKMDWYIITSNLKEINFDNVNINPDENVLQGRLENGNISMNNVTFHGLYLDLNNGTFRLTNSLILACNDLIKSLRVSSDTFHFEGNSVDVGGPFCFNIKADQVVMTRNRFHYLHQHVFYFITARTISRETVPFVFSYNHISHIDEIAFDVENSVLEEFTFAYKVENNTLDCACRNLDFFKKIATKNSTRARQPFYRKFEESTYCTTETDCESIKIDSIPNLDLLCSWSHVDESGCFVEASSGNNSTQEV